MPVSNALDHAEDKRTWTPIPGTFLMTDRPQDWPGLFHFPPPPPPPAIPPARLQHLARHLHQLGPRCVYEAIRELIAGRDPATSLEAYAHLDPAIAHALGADRFPGLRALS